MSTSDALKELLSSVHHALLHVHACMCACSCYMHVSSLIDVVLEQYMLHAACTMSITCVGFCATPSGTQMAKINQCAVCVHSNSILVESNGQLLFNFGFEVDLLNA